jgi:hypothetical protein
VDPNWAPDLSERRAAQSVEVLRSSLRYQRQERESTEQRRTLIKKLTSIAVWISQDYSAITEALWNRSEPQERPAKSCRSSICKFLNAGAAANGQPARAQSNRSRRNLRMRAGRWTSYSTGQKQSDNLKFSR